MCRNNYLNAQRKFSSATPCFYSIAGTSLEHFAQKKPCSYFEPLLPSLPANPFWYGGHFQPKELPDKNVTCQTWYLSVLLVCSWLLDSRLRYPGVSLYIYQEYLWVPNQRALYSNASSYSHKIYNTIYCKQVHQLRSKFRTSTLQTRTTRSISFKAT
jgi:hypothetical protein